MSKMRPKHVESKRQKSKEKSCDPALLKKAGNQGWLKKKLGPGLGQKWAEACKGPTTNKMATTAATTLSVS